MEDVRVDSEGNVRCWNCGGKHFLNKRTGRAHAIRFLTVGVGALAAKKKLKCNQCGKFNQVGRAKPFENDPPADMGPGQPNMSGGGWRYPGEQVDWSEVGFDAVIGCPRPDEHVDVGRVRCSGFIERDRSVNTLRVSLRANDTGNWLGRSGEWVTRQEPHQALLERPNTLSTQWVFWLPQLFPGEYEVHVATGVTNVLSESQRFTVTRSPQESEARDVGGEEQAAPSEEPKGSASIADQLLKLADLRERGALTEEEFSALKAKLLEGG